MFYKSILSSVSILSILLSGCSNDTKEQDLKPSVKTVKVLDLNKSASSVRNVDFPAEIHAMQDTTMAFEVSGKIVEFNFKEGERVKKGEVIAQLDNDIFQANHNLALANYTQAKADYARYETLYKSKTVAKVEFEKQKQNLDVTQAQYQVAKKNLAETKLVAEFDGILAKKLVTDFERVNAKQPIVRLQDDSSFKVKFFAPEKEVLALKTELTPKKISELIDFYVVFAEGKDNMFEAQFLDISTTAEKITRTFEVTLQIKPKKDVNILPGMTATVRTIGKEKNNAKSFLIPFKAVFTDETKKSYVWNIDDENKVFQQEVILGAISNDKVEVLKGLSSDSKIVISGIRFLSENDTVQEYQKLGN